MRPGVFLCFVCLCAPAQLRRLATDGSGAFATLDTKLELRGQDGSSFAKIYTVREGGIQLFIRRDSSDSSVSDGFFEVGSAEWTSDGTAMAFSGSRVCAPPDPFDFTYCRFYPVTFASLRKEGADTPLGFGTGRISANGRWVFLYQSAGNSALVDLASGERRESFLLSPSVAPVGRRVVADDGSVVYRTFDRLIFHRPGGDARELLPAQDVDWAFVSRDARLVYYQTLGDAPSIRRIDMESGTDEAIVEAIEGCLQPALSDDGRALFFVSGANWMAANNRLVPQVWMFDLRTGELNQLTGLDKAVREIAVSGDGRVVWALDAVERIWRIDVLSREAHLAVTGQPVLDVAGRPADLAPGSRYVFPGIGMDSGRLSLAGNQLEILQRSDTGLSVLIPWETATGETTLTMDNPDSPFQPRELFTRIFPAAPRYWSRGQDLRILSAFIVDGETLTEITPETPAPRGGVVELHMTGLGRIDPDGKPMETMRWEYQNGPLEPLSAVRLDDGTYRARIRLPYDWPGDQLNVFARAIYSNQAVGDLGWIPFR